MNLHSKRRRHCWAADCPLSQRPTQARQRLRDRPITLHQRPFAQHVYGCCERYSISGWIRRRTLRTVVHKSISNLPLTVTSANQSIIPPAPRSGMINSVGIYNCSFAPVGSTCTQKTRPLELVFPPSTKVRLRFINAGTHAQFRVSVDEHTLKVIGALYLFVTTLPLLTGHPEADDTPVRGPAVHRIPIVLPPSGGEDRV